MIAKITKKNIKTPYDNDTVAAYHLQLRPKWKGTEYIIIVKANSNIFGKYTMIMKSNADGHNTTSNGQKTYDGHLSIRKTLEKINYKLL